MVGCAFLVFCAFSIALLNLLLRVDDLPLSVVQSCAYLTSETVCLPLRFIGNGSLFKRMYQEW